MRRLLWLSVALVTAACSSSLPNYEARTHVVQSGDTLYSIAFRYELDHTTLARWNGLDDPDLIFAGQRLRLRPPPDAGASASAPPPASRGSRASEPSSASRGSAASAPSRPAPAEDAGARPPQRSGPSASWRWPTDGRVVTPFGSASAIASGIGIGGRAGQPVNAAAAGRVVYAGTGLIGYGQLIIIKHDDTYLSAYGYNDRVLVSQGDDVARGQKIAEMGLGPQREPRLHFEIRRNGTPVNPLQLVSPG